LLGVARLLHAVVRKITVGKAEVQAMRVVDLVQIVRGSVKSDPLALLCDKPQCTRCNAVRAEVWSRGEGVSQEAPKA